MREESRYGGGSSARRRKLPVKVATAARREGATPPSVASEETADRARLERGEEELRNREPLRALRAQGGGCLEELRC